MVATVVAAAKAGDMAAGKIILDRMAGAKGRTVELDLPPVEDATGLVAAMAELVAAMASAEYTPMRPKLARVLSEQQAGD